MPCNDSGPMYDDEDRPRRGRPKRSVIVMGHKTSVSLEPEFWNQLQALAAEANMGIGAYITEIGTHPDRIGNLSSSIRLHVLAKLKAKIASMASVLKMHGHIIDVGFMAGSNHMAGTNK